MCLKVLRFRFGHAKQNSARKSLRPLGSDYRSYEHGAEQVFHTQTSVARESDCLELFWFGGHKSGP